jgi:hypothetical protein
MRSACRASPQRCLKIKAFNASVRRNRPQAWQQLILTRLSAQTHVGITETLQQPFTAAEAEQFAAPIARAVAIRHKDEASTRWEQRYKDLAGAFQETLGPYAEDAFRQVVLKLSDGSSERRAFAADVISDVFAEAGSAPSWPSPGSASGYPPRQGEAPP